MDYDYLPLYQIYILNIRIFFMDISVSTLYVLICSEKS